MKNTSPEAIGAKAVAMCGESLGLIDVEQREIAAVVAVLIRSERAAVARLAIKVDPYLGSRSGKVIAKAILARNKPPKKKP